MKEANGYMVWSMVDLDNQHYARIDGPTVQGRLRPEEARRVAVELIQVADAIQMRKTPVLAIYPEEAAEAPPPKRKRSA